VYRWVAASVGLHHRRLRTCSPVHCHCRWLVVNLSREKHGSTKMDPRCGPLHPDAPHGGIQPGLACYPWLRLRKEGSIRYSWFKASRQAVCVGGEEVVLWQCVRSRSCTVTIATQINRRPCLRRAPPARRPPPAPLPPPVLLPPPLRLRASPPGVA